MSLTLHNSSLPFDPCVPSVPFSSTKSPVHRNAEPLASFTVFCQERTGEGTIHICCVKSLDAAAAIIAGKQQCMDDWNASPKCASGEPFYTVQNIHCLGVAKGDVEILDWQDICNV